VILPPPFGFRGRSAETNASMEGELSTGRAQARPQSLVQSLTWPRARLDLRQSPAAVDPGKGLTVPAPLGPSFNLVKIAVIFCADECGSAIWRCICELAASNWPFDFYTA
jgi:hypothetical protein